MTEEASVPVSFTRKRSSRATARTKAPTESTWRSAASSWCSSTVPGNSSSADRVRRISARISSRRSSIGTSGQKPRAPLEGFGVGPAEGTLLGGNADGGPRRPLDLHGGDVSTAGEKAVLWKRVSERLAEARKEAAVAAP